MAYIEAMAAGLPVIATSCGGPEDFVNESNGILIEVDNHEELTKALLYMYKNSDNTIGSNFKRNYKNIVRKT